MYRYTSTYGVTHAHKYAWDYNQLFDHTFCAVPAAVVGSQRVRASGAAGRAVVAGTRPRACSCSAAPMAACFPPGTHGPSQAGGELGQSCVWVGTYRSLDNNLQLGCRALTKFCQSLDNDLQLSSRALTNLHQGFEDITTLVWVRHGWTGPAQSHMQV